MRFPKNYKTTTETSKRMSHIHLKESKAETLLARSLWHEGIRYRKNYKEIPGSPDIAITRYKIAVFVDGEFWHGKNWNDRKEKLKRNRDYWIKKIEENINRDKRVDVTLAKMGWIPVHFWEEDVLKHTDYCVQLVLYFIRDRMDKI
ncbi:very short patch repair endonuclease [Lentilactobacillus sp. Marseille-Q4993]|uniref:very short patch repair endonuclease n=1 Tax=Lentilactobacillus sp. Marseille-Q4993 TaxID=3039492 RepID=UPI0024BCEDA9|nr:very short patch repair endonuclease [Lentilactobacillus sp. Marseille-Q4993]